MDCGETLFFKFNGYQTHIRVLMEKTIGISDLNAFPDKELVDMLKESSDALTIIYKKHKEYCLNFMRTMFDDPDEINDIYQDAVIVFYEKAKNPSFSLTCSIQTYLNSVCRNQVLVRLKQRNKVPFMRVINGDEDFLDNITDWHDESALIKNDRVTILEGILMEMKESASKCYEVLVRFFYQNQTMEKIAEAMEFNNSRSAITQKYKCQEKLKSEMFKRLRK